MPRKSVRSSSFITSDVDSSNDADDFEAFDDDFIDDDRWDLKPDNSHAFFYTLFKWRMP